jgi:hypothetical protein
LDDPIDVTLLVRNVGSAGATPYEDGVRCSIRRGVPIVEHGPDALDPYEPWLAHRVSLGESVVSRCELTAEQAMDPLRHAIVERIRPVSEAAGLDPESVACDIQRNGGALVVHLTVPIVVAADLEQAMAVRVLDAVRASGRTYGQVGVQVHALPTFPAGRAR